MRSSATAPPEFWTTFQLYGTTGAPQYHWRHRSGPAYALLQPYLHAWPEPLVATMICRDCHRTRRITNPHKNVYILEQADDCTDCQSDRSIKREDLLRTSLNGRVLSEELGKALDFTPGSLPEQLPPSPLVPIGSVRHNGMSLPVILLFTNPASAINLDAAFPSTETRVILHLEMEYALILALQQRRFVPLHLPSLVMPKQGGTFEAKRSLSNVLSDVSIPAVAHASTLHIMQEKLDALPVQTASLLGRAPARKRRYAGEVIEPGFSANSGFRLIHFNKDTYRLGKKPAAAILFIYHQMKELKWKKVPEDDILEEIYGSDRKKWPQNKNARVTKLFRTGDAKRLRDAGFIVTDGEGYFSLSPKMNS